MSGSECHVRDVRRVAALREMAVMAKGSGSSQRLAEATEAPEMVRDREMGGKPGMETESEYAPGGRSMVPKKPVASDLSERWAGPEREMVAPSMGMEPSAMRRKPMRWPRETSDFHGMGGTATGEGKGAVPPKDWAVAGLVRAARNVARGR